MSMASEVRLSSNLRALRVPAGLVVLGVVLTAALVAQLDAGPVLVALAGAVAAVAIWWYPSVATVLAVFLLYSNLPTALRDTAPAAQIFAASFGVPLAIPFAH